MNHGRIIIRITRIIFTIIVISVLCCCAPKDPAEIASKLAQEWTSNNVGSVSNNIVSLLVNNNPPVEKAITMVIADEINNRITWECSQPQKLDEERYNVVATISSLIELPVLGSYKLSVNYNLDIDTKQKKVTNAAIDASSFAMRKQ
jgi:hypothetical protein